MDESMDMDVPVTLKMSDIEHQVDGDAMAIDEESGDSGDSSVEERPEIPESEGSSESYAGESSSSSESSASHFEEAEAESGGWKGKKSNRKIASQSDPATARRIKVAKRDLVVSTNFESGNEHSDESGNEHSDESGNEHSDESGNEHSDESDDRNPQNRAGVEAGGQEETIGRSEFAISFEEILGSTFCTLATSTSLKRTRSKSISSMSNPRTCLFFVA